MSLNGRNWRALSSLARQRSMEDDEEFEKARRRRDRMSSSVTHCDSISEENENTSVIRTEADEQDKSSVFAHSEGDTIEFTEMLRKRQEDKRRYQQETLESLKSAKSPVEMCEEDRTGKKECTEESREPERKEVLPETRRTSSEDSEETDRRTLKQGREISGNIDREIISGNTDREISSNAARETSSNADRKTSSNAARETSSNAARETSSNAAGETSSNADGKTSSNAARETSSNAARETSSNTAGETSSIADGKTSSKAARETSSNADRKTSSNSDRKTSSNADGRRNDSTSESSSPLSPSHTTRVFISLGKPKEPMSPKVTSPVEKERKFTKQPSVEPFNCQAGGAEMSKSQSEEHPKEGEETRQGHVKRTRINRVRTQDEKQVSSTVTHVQFLQKESEDVDGCSNNVPFLRGSSRAISFRMVKPEPPNQSLQRSASMRISSKGVSTNKDRVDQYVKAIQKSGSLKSKTESAKYLPCPLEGIASKRNMFEKENSQDRGNWSPSMKKDIRPGDVASKRNLWENRADSVDKN
ncbi:ladinin-1 isoform X1 [Callorhinchus milii]|uniref:ladinin-1 isoform X1 n=1 Tax=Callorhinchus milii TaxID=7868 RepID=UPI001C3F9182|nr:ladinin-1 isoform X1 [Callorhinchus milii]